MFSFFNYLIIRCEMNPSWGVKGVAVGTYRHVALYVTIYINMPR